MVYTYNSSADSMFFHLSSILWNLVDQIWIQIRLFQSSKFYKLIIKYYYTYIFLFIALLLITIIALYKLFWVVRTPYILITHRDITTKQICNILFCKLNINHKLYITPSTASNNEKEDMFIDVYPKNSMYFLSLKHKHAIEHMYQEIKEIIFGVEGRKIDIYIYDTHDRYIDLLCAICGEKELMNQSSILIKQGYIFSAELEGKSIRFYLVDDLLKTKKSLSVLEMLQSLEPEYNALQTIYYYHTEKNLSLKNKIVDYLSKIVDFVARNLNKG